MKKTLLTLLTCLITSLSFADSIFMDGFEYANHDMTIPIGWTCQDESWLCGYLDKDHNRTAHTGNWYAFTNADDSWMFMPLFFSTQLKYRFSYWAISDGTYEVEFWAGDEADVAHMTHLLFSTTVNGNEYEKIATYIETIPSNFQYFGIHAVAAEGAYYLTIDDVNVDMVAKYEFISTPSSADTVLYPGSQATYHFNVQNLGYEPIDVILSPSHEYFTNFHFFVEGSQCTTFHLEPDETKQVVAEATLLPSIQAGTSCWLDIMLVLDCDCATSMTTLWVTVIEPAAVNEHRHIGLYPNPSKGHINLEGTGKAIIINSLGQTVMKQWIDGKEVIHLPKGIYIVRMENSDGVSIEKLVVE